MFIQPKDNQHDGSVNLNLVWDFYKGSRGDNAYLIIFENVAGKNNKKWIFSTEQERDLELSRIHSLSINIK